MQNNFAELPSYVSQTMDLIFSTPVLKIGLVLFGMFLAQRIVDLLTNRYFERAYQAQLKKNKVKISKKRFDTLSQSFRKLASVAIWIIGIFLIISATPLQQYLAAIFASAGVIGIAVGIAGKDIFMDLYVGLMALIEDQYRVGDVIIIDQDHSGTVEEVSLRTVKLRDINGSVHIVPHSLARSIINQTYGYSNVNIELGLAYDTDLDKIKTIVNEVGEQMAAEDNWKRVFTKPISYQTLLRFDESQMTIRVQGQVKPGKQWDVASEYRIRVKKAFDDNGVEVPFPQRIIRQINEDAEKVVNKKSKNKQ